MKTNVSVWQMGHFYTKTFWQQKARVRFTAVARPLWMQDEGWGSIPITCTWVFDVIAIILLQGLSGYGLNLRETWLTDLKVTMKLGSEMRGNQGIHIFYIYTHNFLILYIKDCLIGIGVSVSDYWQGVAGSIPGTLTIKKKCIRSGKGSTQPREDNWVATWLSSSGSD